MMKKVYVLYGSQTGNAESIASDFAAQLSSKGLSVECQQLNAYKKISFKELASFLLIICATTGNGDAPENAETWWRSVKLRSAAKDMFEGVPYSVLGLGDTNYDKFCNMGKSIDKRLEELGGQRQLEIFCADEGTGNMEEVVEAWKEAVEEKLAAINNNGSSTSVASECDATTSLKTEDVSITIAECVPSSDAALLQAESAFSSMPKNILSLVDVARIFGLEKKLTEELAVKPKPAREKSVNYSFATLEEASEYPTKDSSLASGADVPEDGWTAAEPFSASIIGAEWLTSKSNCDAGDLEKVGVERGDYQQWGLTKRVIRMELSLEGSGIEYGVGDSIGIICPNAAYAVEILIERLQKAHPELHIHWHTPLKTKSDEGTLIISLGDVLSYKFDLMGPPKKAVATTLAQYCTDPSDALGIGHLCGRSEPGKTLWANFVDAQCIGLAEFIAMFPSCIPTLPQLLSCLTSMPPRYYSLTTSPLCNRQSVAVAFSVVRNVSSIPTAAGKPGALSICRSGLCTTYLEELLTPWLRSSSVLSPTDGSGRSVKMFLKPTQDFHPPASIATPMILIGPGTGVAPFMGFLDHRTKQLEQRLHANGDTCCGTWRGNMELELGDLPLEHGVIKGFMSSLNVGDVHLFFGCRDEHDYLFKSALEKKHADGVLTSLDVAMSRVSTEKVYVTNKIQTRSKEIADLVLNRGAYIFICGDGNHMAKDVHKALVQALVQYSKELKDKGKSGPRSTISSALDEMSEDDAEEYLQEMKDRNRYVLDIWS